MLIAALITFNIAQVDAEGMPCQYRRTENGQVVCDDVIRFPELPPSYEEEEDHQSQPQPQPQPQRPTPFCQTYWCDDDYWPIPTDDDYYPRDFTMSSAINVYRGEEEIPLPYSTPPHYSHPSQEERIEEIRRRINYQENYVPGREIDPIYGPSPDQIRRQRRLMCSSPNVRAATGMSCNPNTL